MFAKTFFSLLALFIGLNFSSAYAADTLNGSQWTLVDLHGKAALSDTTVTLSFEDGKVFGSDGCNRYRGTFTAKVGKLSFGKNLGSTMMMCPDRVAGEGHGFLLQTNGSASHRARLFAARYQLRQPALYRSRRILDPGAGRHDGDRPHQYP